MSIGSKDAVVGGAVVAGIVANLVFTQYRCGQLQKQVDELRKEVTVLAQYIRLNEEKGHSLQVGAPNPAPPQAPVQNPQPVVHTPQPRPAPVQHRPVQQPVHTPAPQPQQQPQAPVVRPPVRRPVQRPAPPPEPEPEEEEAESPPPSNRRTPQPVAAPPRRFQPPPPQAQIPKAESPPDGPESPPPQPKQPVRRFRPASDDEDTPMVSSKRLSGTRVQQPKSILKTPQKGKEEASAGDGADDDILSDIEQMAKSSTRGEKEESPEHKAGHKSRMEKTARIAAELQKKREARMQQGQ